jgi:hypothetical protein
MSFHPYYHATLHISHINVNRRKEIGEVFCSQQLRQCRLVLVAKQYNLPSPDGSMSPEDATLMQRANREPVYDVLMDVDEDRHVDVREDDEVGI